MRSVKAIRAAKAGCILISALLCALGILLIARPELSLSLVGILVGVVLIAFGAFRLVGYFSRDLYQLAFQFDLAFGVLLMALGAAMLVRPENLLGLLGVAVLANGLFRIQTALDARRFGLGSWWLILALAVAAGAVGATLLLKPEAGARAAAMLTGISLLAEGILSLVVTLCTVKIVRRRRNKLETDFES